MVSRPSTGAQAQITLARRVEREQPRELDLGGRDPRPASSSRTAERRCGAPGAAAPAGRRAGVGAGEGEDIASKYAIGTRVARLCERRHSRLRALRIFASRSAASGSPSSGK